MLHGCASGENQQMVTVRTLVIAAISLIVLGVVSIALQPVVNPKPEAKCAAQGEPSSGFVDGDKSDCNITITSWNEISDWESSPKPLRIVGLVLILAGLVSGVVGVVRRIRGGGAMPPE